MISTYGATISCVLEAEVTDTFYRHFPPINAPSPTPGKKNLTPFIAHCSHMATSGAKTDFFMKKDI